MGNMVSFYVYSILEMGSQFIYEMKDIFLHILITWSIN